MLVYVEANVFSGTQRCNIEGIYRRCMSSILFRRFLRRRRKRKRRPPLRLRRSLFQPVPLFYYDYDVGVSASQQTSSKQAVRERESGERRVFGFGCFREVVLSLALCDTTGQQTTEKKSLIPSSPFSLSSHHTAFTTKFFNFNIFFFSGLKEVN